MGEQSEHRDVLPHSPTSCCLPVSGNICFSGLGGGGGGGGGGEEGCGEGGVGRGEGGGG